MKIIYIANIRIPTEKAHGFQIIKMCESFSNLGVELELVVPTRKNKVFNCADIFHHYKINQNFVIKKIFSIDPRLILKFPSGFYIKFQALFFIISLFFYLLFKKDKDDCIFYTRDEYLLPFLSLFSNKIVWEAHALPRNRNKYLKYFKNCFKIIVLTQGVKDILKEDGI